MNRSLTFISDVNRYRLDRFLDDRCPDLSRSRIQRLISQGCVTVDGLPTKPSSILQVGQRVVIGIPDPVESHLKAQDIPVKVVYQDSDLLVVDKPAGLTVHPAPGHPDNTLVNALLALCPDLQGIGGTIRPGIVHRLDKDTSGLLVVAKNEQAHRFLASQLGQRQFTKVYIALVRGKVLPLEAVIEAAIGRDPSNRKRMAVTTNGREAITRYRVIEHYQGRTMVEVRLETGRTHQIRVHFASLGHPLVGDVVYGSAEPGLNRQFLHARLLGFRLPSSGNYAEFESALPLDLQGFLNTLKAVTTSR